MKKTLDAATYQNLEQTLYDALANADLTDWQDIKIVARDILATMADRDTIDGAVDATTIYSPTSDDVAGAILDKLFDVAEIVTLPKLAASAGYYRIDMKRLLADLRRQPGCERVAMRTLADYVAMRTSPRGVVLIGLAAALCCSIDDIVSARRRGDHE